MSAMEAIDEGRPRAIAVEMVVIAAVLFNAILALVNSNLVALNSTPVIASEILIDGAAIVLIFSSWDERKLPWLILALFLSFLGAVFSLGSETFDAKFLRDVLIIPIFVMLGLCATRLSVVRVLIATQSIVLAVMLFEGAMSIEFGKIFNVASYYVNTRGFSTSEFWSSTTSDLFVSATRPGERFLLPFLDIHRLSSIFLEPVSLGNYCVIGAMILGALWDDIRGVARLFLIISILIILVGCDGRFATSILVIVLVTRLATPWLPRYANIVYLPAILSLSAFVSIQFNLSTEGDDFPTRTAGSIKMLSKMSVADIFGMNSQSAYAVMDSGIAYLLYSQSIIGAAVLWMAVAVALPQKDRASVFFAHMTSIYFGLNLLISYSVFSIKTAGLLWFAYGAIDIRNRRVIQRDEAGDEMSGSSIVHVKA